MLQELDYILDYNGDIWIVTYFHADEPYGYIIYKRSSEGDRCNSITGYRYFKCNESISCPIPAAKQIYRPREFFHEHYDELEGLWRCFADQMIMAGIQPERIGIFGSYLLGFEIIKDIDFVLYGDDSLKTYYENKDRIKKCCGCRYISKEHIDYQIKKYGSNYHDSCDLKGIIKRNWSGIQTGDGIGVLSTPRFIPDIKVNIPKCTGDNRVIECTVVSGLTSSFVPRYCEVLYNKELYRLITPFWMFQSFAKDGDRIRIRCDVNEKDKLFLLISNDHWLQYLD